MAYFSGLREKRFVFRDFPCFSTGHSVGIICTSFADTQKEEMSLPAKDRDKDADKNKDSLVGGLL